eukprot:gene511-283_t
MSKAPRFPGKYAPKESHVRKEPAAFKVRVGKRSYKQSDIIQKWGVLNSDISKSNFSMATFSDGKSNKDRERERKSRKDVAMTMRNAEQRSTKEFPKVPAIMDAHNVVNDKLTGQPMEFGTDKCSYEQLVVHYIANIDVNDSHKLIDFSAKYCNKSMEVDMSNVKKSCGCFGKKKGPAWKPATGLNEKLYQQRDVLYVLAAMPFDLDNEYHFKALCTVFRTCMGDMPVDKLLQLTDCDIGDTPTFAAFKGRNSLGMETQKSNNENGKFEKKEIILGPSDIDLDIEKPTVPVHQVTLDSLQSKGSRESPKKNSNTAPKFEIDDVVIPEYGFHWIYFGMQDDDPTTPLDRVGGFLAVVCMLYFSSKFPQLCAQHFAITRKFGDIDMSPASPMTPSNHTKKPKCPFGLINIVISRFVLLRFHEGRLSRLCNQENSVFDVFFRYHAALLTEFILNHVDEPEVSIEDILARVETISGTQDPSQYMKHFKQKCPGHNYSLNSETAKAAAENARE